MKYCTECGARMAGDESQHIHDQAGLRAMQRNPLLALLIKPDGTTDRHAPIILGGGKSEDS